MYEAVFLSHVWANLHFNNHCSTLSPAVGVLRDFNRWLLGAHTVIPYYCFNVQVPDCSDVGQFSIPWQSPCTLSSMKFLLIWAHFCIFLLPSALEKLIFWLLLLWWLSVSSVSSPTWWLSIQHSQGCLLWKVLHFNTAWDFSVSLKDGVLSGLLRNPSPPQFMEIPAPVSCSSSAVCLSK